MMWQTRGGTRGAPIKSGAAGPLIGAGRPGLGNGLARPSRLGLSRLGLGRLGLGRLGLGRLGLGRLGLGRLGPRRLGLVLVGLSLSLLVVEGDRPQVRLGAQERLAENRLGVGEERGTGDPQPQPSTNCQELAPGETPAAGGEPATDGSPVTAQDRPEGEPAEGADPQAQRVQRLREKLLSTQGVRIPGRSLRQALDQLAEDFGFRYEFDPAALEETGVDPEQAEVTINVRRRKLIGILRELLAQHRLRPVLDGDALRVVALAAPPEGKKRVRVNDDAPLESLVDGEIVVVPAEPEGTNRGAQGELPEEPVETPPGLEDANVFGGLEAMKEQEQGLRQQFQMQFAPLVRGETRLATEAVGDDAKLRDMLNEKAQARREELIGQQVKLQMQLMRGWNGPNPPTPPDVPAELRKTFEQVLETQATAEVLEHYRQSIRSRTERRQQATIRGLVAQMDRVVYLSGEQRTDLEALLKAHWQPLYGRYLELLQNEGNQWFPKELTPKLGSVLSADQLQLWEQSSPNDLGMFWGWSGERFHIFSGVIQRNEPADGEEGPPADDVGGEGQEDPAEQSEGPGEEDSHGDPKGGEPTRVDPKTGEPGAKANTAGDAAATPPAEGEPDQPAEAAEPGAKAPPAAAVRQAIPMVRIQVLARPVVVPARAPPPIEDRKQGSPDEESAPDEEGEAVRGGAEAEANEKAAGAAPVARGNAQGVVTVRVEAVPGGAVPAQVIVGPARVVVAPGPGAGGDELPGPGDLADEGNAEVSGPDMPAQVAPGQEEPGVVVERLLVAPADVAVQMERVPVEGDADGGIKPEEDWDELDRPRPRQQAMEAVIDESNFESWIWQGRASTATEGRRSLERQLAVRLADLARVSALDAEQIRRLKLAAGLDMERFFADYRVLRQKFLRDRLQPNGMNNFWEALQPLQARISGGLFGGESFFQRFAPRALSETQLAQFQQSERDRRAYRAHARLDLVLVAAEEALGLTNEQATKFNALARETLVVNEKLHPQFELYAILLRMERIPQDQLAVTLDPEQRKLLTLAMAQFQGLKPMLKEDGVGLPAIDEPAAEGAEGETSEGGQATGAGQPGPASDAAEQAPQESGVEPQSVPDEGANDTPRTTGRPGPSCPEAWRGATADRGSRGRVAVWQLAQGGTTWTTGNGLCRSGVTCHVG